MMDSEVLFRRLLAVSKQRDVNLEQMLSHELAPVPPSLFNDDGTMRKTTNADLAKKLESNCDEIHMLAVLITLHTSLHGIPKERGNEDGQETPGGETWSRKRGRWGTPGRKLQPWRSAGSGGEL